MGFARSTGIRQANVIAADGSQKGDDVRVAVGQGEQVKAVSAKEA